MNFEKLFTKIDELKGEYLQFWMDVVNCESPTDYKQGVDMCSKIFIDKAETFGWKIDVQKQAVSGDAVCITLNPDAPGKPFCLSAHLDTVHPIGCFGTPTVRIEDEKLYGPGVTDCKGGAVSAMLAMDALSKCGFNERPVKLILQSDEENSSRNSNKTTIQYMVEQAKDAIAFLNLESCTENNKACIARKGIAKYKIEITGKACHASVCLKGVSAIREAAMKILELEKNQDPDGITVSCGIISGGSAENTVPEHCMFTVDTRFANEEQRKAIDEFVHKVTQTSYVEGTTAKATLLSFRIAMAYKEINEKLLNALNDIWADCGLVTCEAYTANGGSDAAYTTDAGIPTLDNLGICGGGIHTISEFAYIDSLPLFAKRLATAAAALKEEDLRA